MKKLILFVVVMIALMFTLGVVAANAKVDGQCSNCHTMHNSQDGADVDANGPYNALTKGDCLGCHGQSPSGTANIISNIPQVLHAGNDLAGGNFAYITGGKANVTADSSTAGHNVSDIGVDEATLTAPPGDENSTRITAGAGGNFTCAGTYGCHGNRATEGNFASISGAHHADDSALKFGTISETGQGATVATSYRFLLGVKGGEDDDWQATASASDHNEYKGAAGTGSESSISSPGGGTISGLCGECHGNFHGSADIGGTSSPWKRHPTDISLPASGEYASYNPDAATAGEYSLEAPVARTAIPNASTATVTPSGTSDDIVMCLSCHRAHASPNQDMLRWNYSDMVAGGGGSGGCMVCHSNKN